MKAVFAYIQKHRLTEVTLALHKLEGLSGMTVLDARGFGRPGKSEDLDKVPEDVADFTSNVKIEILCPDALAKDVIETIRAKAHTGLRGDGTVYAFKIEKAVRISTGDTGEAAI